MYRCVGAPLQMHIQRAADLALCQSYSRDLVAGGQQHARHLDVGILTQRPHDHLALQHAHRVDVDQPVMIECHHRLIYVNTVSVLEREMIVRALGEDADVQVTGVLLTASDKIARVRLTQREIGSALDVHLERSANASIHLTSTAPGWVHRVPTDGRSVREIAEEIVELSGWGDEDDA